MTDVKGVIKMTRAHNYFAFLNVMLCISYVLLFSTAAFAKDFENTAKETPLLQRYLQQERENAGLISKKIKVGDVTWTYNEGGATNKPSILLIHGLSGSRDHWNRVARYLTPSYHVIVPDLPSIDSTSQNFDTSIPNISSELRQFTKAIHIDENLNIAGHSLGGSVAAMYASQYAFDTQSLLLISSNGIYKHATTSFSRNPENLKKLIVTKPGDLNDVLLKLMKNPPKLPEAIQHEQEKLLISQSVKAQQTIEQMVKLNRIYTADSFARLTKNIEAPTLIIWGKQDQILNYEVADELKKLVKRAENPIILNNVGHMPLIEADQLVARYYLPFLSKTQQMKNPLADKMIPLN